MWGSSVHAAEDFFDAGVDACSALLVLSFSLQCDQFGKHLDWDVVLGTNFTEALMGFAV
jgi:hypothetical protein